LPQCTSLQGTLYPFAVGHAPTGKVAVKGIGLPFASFGMYKFEPEFPGPLIPPSNFPTLTSIYLVNRLARFGFQLSRRCPFPEPENSLASNQRAGLTPCSLVTTNANYILNSKLSHATLITLPSIIFIFN